MKAKILSLLFSMAIISFTGEILGQDACTGYVTYTQGGYGGAGAPAKYMAANFNAVFGSGLVIGSINKLVLTSASAVNDFLPSGSTASVLPSGTLTNPGTSYSNVLAGQLVALTLSLGFDSYDVNFASSTGYLGDLLIGSGTFAGMTVSEFLAIANQVIGGSSNAYSLSDINVTATAINQNYDNGTVDNGFLICYPPLTLNLTVLANVLCYGDNTGSVQSVVEGGKTPYSYLWSNGATTANLTGVPAGTYSLTVTDALGNTANGSVTITQPEMLVSTAVKTDVSCFGGSDGTATVSIAGGTAPYSILWSTGSTESSITGLAPGTYSVTVTDAHGCSESGSVTITQPEMLVSTAVKTDVSCFGGSDGTATVSIAGGTAPYSILWSTGSTDASITGLSAGTYSVQVTDAHGCMSSAEVTIGQPPVLVVTVSGTNVVCFGENNGTASVSVEGGTAPYSILWSTGSTESSITGLAPGTYSVTVTDAHGCSESGSVTITQPEMLVSTAVKTDVSCFGGSDGTATVSIAGGTAPYSILWSTGSTDASITGLSAGTYSVQVTDAHGCMSSAEVTIGQPPVLVVTVSGTNVVCFGENNGTASVSVEGGTAPYSILWSTGSTESTITGLAPGTYSVTVTDAHGCSESGSVTITEPYLLRITGIDATTVQCENGTGEVVTHVVGGTAPYTYEWIGISISNDSVAQLPVGTWNLIVTDANGCNAEGSVTMILLTYGQFTTVTQGGWGAKASGNNWGTYLNNHFAQAFPNGVKVGSNGRFLLLTSTDAVRAFLPSSGTPAVLSAGTMINPTSKTLKNTLAGQTVALALSLGFDAYYTDFGVSTGLLSDMLVANGLFQGWSVGAVFTEANNALGGNSTYSLTNLTAALDSINRNFDNGTVNRGFLVSPCTTSQVKAKGAGTSSYETTVENTMNVTAHNLALYPNPASNNVSVEFALDYNSGIQIYLYNLKGQVVKAMYSGNVTANIAFSQTFNVDDVMKGVYMIKLVTEKETQIQKLLIK